MIIEHKYNSVDLSPWPFLVLCSLFYLTLGGAATNKPLFVALKKNADQTAKNLLSSSLILFLCNDSTFVSFMCLTFLLLLFVLRYRVKLLSQVANFQVKVRFWCLDFYNKTYLIWNMDIMLTLFIVRISQNPIMAVLMLIYYIYFFNGVVAYFLKHLPTLLAKVLAKRDKFLEQELQKNSWFSVLISFYIFRLSLINSLINFSYKLIGKDVMEFIIGCFLVLPVGFFSTHLELYGVYITFLIWLCIYLLVIRIRLEFFQKLLINNSALEHQYLNNISTILRPGLLIYHKFSKQHDFAELTLMQRRFTWARVQELTEELNRTGRAAIFGALVGVPLCIGCLLYDAHISQKNAQMFYESKKIEADSRINAANTEADSRIKVATINADGQKIEAAATIAQADATIAQANATIAQADASVKTAQLNAETTVKAAQIKADAKVAVAKTNAEKWRAQYEQEHTNTSNRIFAETQLENRIKVIKD